MRFRCAGRDTIIDAVTVKASPLQKMMGLRFVAEGRAWFPFRSTTRPAIDMVGVRFPLDIAFLDEDHRIQEIVPAEPFSLRPRSWRTYTPQQPCRSVLEVEQGLLERLDIREGCRLEPVQTPHTTTSR